MFERLRVAVIGVGILCLLPTAGLALPVFDVGTRVDAALLPRAQDGMTSTDGSPVSGHAAISALGRIGSADASAGGGYIGVRANSFAENATGSPYTVDSLAGGSFEVDISTGSCVSVPLCGASAASINLSLGGVFAASDDGPVGANAEGYVSVYISLMQGATTVFSQSGSAGAITIPGNTPPANIMPWNNGNFGPPTGLLSGHTLNSSFTFQSGSFLLAPNSDYRLLVALTVSSTANTRSNLQIGDRSDLTVDFANTLTFGPGAVFNGSFDFSIDSPDANIVGNTWTDPRTVPEPTTGVLVGFGLGLVGWARRRRRV